MKLTPENFKLKAPCVSCPFMRGGVKHGPESAFGYAAHLTFGNRIRGAHAVASFGFDLIGRLVRLGTRSRLGLPTQVWRAEDDGK